MKRLALIVDRLRLTGEIWLHRHGPWWFVLALCAGGLMGLAMVVLPTLNTQLAASEATLAELRARAASRQEPQAAPLSASERNYQVFQQTLAEEKQVLPTIKAILDAAKEHKLLSTRADYQRGRDANAQVETLQMTVPVKGRYRDIRRWVEEILATQPSVSLNELGFKREDIGADQIEAKVRLTLWHHPAGPSAAAGGVEAGRGGR